MEHNKKRIRLYTIIAICLLIPGVFLPVFSVSKMILFTDTFSITSGILTLFNNGHITLGLIILAGGIVIPSLKVGTILNLTLNHNPATSRRYIELMHKYGRWSFLDVIMVAMFIVVGKTASIIDVTPLPGLYAFLGGVIFLSIATSRASSLFD